jgi:23S rRNA (pseudouridine1915-N3)-methyltransferase
MKLRLLMLGKSRRPELRAVFEDYVKRIGRSCPVEVNEVRDGAAAIKRLDADKAATALLLDAGGQPQDSEALSRWLGEQRDRGTREIILVCGDADGFPESLRKRVAQTLSLSPMTYSHELARVMLAEQLYRALAILAGSPYPK